MSRAPHRRRCQGEGRERGGKVHALSRGGGSGRAQGRGVPTYHTPARCTRASRFSLVCHADSTWPKRATPVYDAASTWGEREKERILCVPAFASRLAIRARTRAKLQATMPSAHCAGASK